MGGPRRLEAPVDDFLVPFMAFFKGAAGFSPRVQKSPSPERPAATPARHPQSGVNIILLEASEFQKSVMNIIILE